jgi:hypothetical protein
MIVITSFPCYVKDLLFMHSFKVYKQQRYKKSTFDMWDWLELN